MAIVGGCFVQAYAIRVEVSAWLSGVLSQEGLGVLKRATLRQSQCYPNVEIRN